MRRHNDNSVNRLLLLLLLLLLAGGLSSASPRPPSKGTWSFGAAGGQAGVRGVLVSAQAAGQAAGLVLARHQWSVSDIQRAN